MQGFYRDWAEGKTVLRTTSHSQWNVICECTIIMIMPPKFTSSFISKNYKMLTLFFSNKTTEKLVVMYFLYLCNYVMLIHKIHVPTSYYI